MTIRTTHRRMWLTALVAGVLATSTAGPGVAQAVDTRPTPSTAPTIQIGVPFHAVALGNGPDVLRLAATVQTGDQLQIAFDNTRGGSDAEVCVLGPVDDYDYDSETAAACTGDANTIVDVNDGASSRFVYTYIRATGQPLIRVSSFFDRATDYFITVEKIIPAVMVQPQQAPTLSLTGPKTSKVGKRISIRGQVLPAAAVGLVLKSKSPAHGWQIAGRTKSDNTGRFSFRYFLGHRGPHKFRVFSSGGAASGVLRVKVR